MLVATILLLAAVGYGLGAVLGPALPLALAGAAVGFVLGMVFVYLSFRDR